MSIAGSLSFSGLGAGTDFTEMISQLRTIKEIPVQRMETWKADWEARIDAFTEIIDLLNELQTRSDALTNLSSFQVSAASSSNTTVADVTCTNDALEGNYAFEVKQLATASIAATQTVYSKNDEGEWDALADENGDPITFSYTLGEDGETITVELDETSTIQDLVDNINNDAANPGVKASLVPTGNGYVFQIQSTETGEANQISFDTTLDSDWNELKAQDAQFVVNGFDAQVLTSSDNSIDGVIDGVTVDLKSTGSINITVAKDTSAMKEAVQEWVDVVNEIQSKLKELTSVSDSEVEISTDTSTGNDSSTAAGVYGIGSVLTGNYAVQLFQTRLNSLITSPATGFTSTLDSDGNFATYSLLSELGITTSTDEGTTYNGLLVIDEDKLDAAISGNPDAVAAFFASSEGTTNTSNFKFANATDNAAAGDYDVTYDLDEFGKVVTDSVYINGVLAVASADGKRYTVADSTNDAYGLAIEFASGSLTKPVDDDGNPITETVSLQRGKAYELSQFISNESRYVYGQNDSNSALAIVRSNYETIVENIETKISNEMDRLDFWETMQKARYARLDAHLGVQSALMTSNASALASAQTW